MRAKMRDNLGTRATHAGTAEQAFDAAAEFNLKQDAGGIVDIEFMVQYAALAWSHQHPELLRYTDNIRILDGLEQAGLMTGDEVRLQGRLQGVPCRGPPAITAETARSGEWGSIHDERRAVMRIWRELGLS